jgi:glycosyltransferase involved in cell wall biosynthesis
MHYRAQIDPLDSEMPRPLWSVMIPTYNCAAYLRKTLESVLQQDPGPERMQIEVVDDCSTKDDPEAVVREMGNGRVAFYRQPQNVGHTKNFETCLNRSRGVLVHQLHGDDLIRIGFYEKMEALFKMHPEMGAAFCRTQFIDETGNELYLSALEKETSGLLESWLPNIARKQRIQTPSIVVRREVYEKMGGFDRRLSWTEDWEMWVRIASTYSVGYEPTVLAEYRTHQSSNTGTYVRTGENMRDVQRAIQIIGQYLNASQKAEISAYALKNYAYHARTTAQQLYQEGDKSGARAQIREAYRMYKNPAFLLSLALLYYKSA